jgi:outer membrane lipoprotein-sorting protein
MRKTALFLAVLVPSLALAQDPLLLLKKVAATYAALPKTTYDFEQLEVREHLDSSHNQSEQRQRIAGSGGRYREETLPSGVLYIFDGQFRWAFNRDRNEYTKTSATSGRATGLSMFELTGYRAKGARLLRQEVVELASGPVMCQVIEVEPEADGNRVQYSPTTYWIDADRSLVLKMNYKYAVAEAGRPNPAESMVTVSFTKAAVGQPVDEPLFRFTPPPDAVQVERLTFGPKSSLVGKDTPEFELKGLDGKTITGASLRGKMVLLQFGARADDDAMPVLEMTYRSLKGNGLTAIYVLPARSRPDAGSPAYTVPVMIDSDGSAAKRFGITYGGTILIDRVGKVVYADPSSRNWLELARVLQKEGLW